MQERKGDIQNETSEVQKTVQVSEEKKEETDQVIDSLTTGIKVIGIGNSGCDSITKMSDGKIDGVRFIGVDIDIIHLTKKTNAHKKILIGKNRHGNYDCYSTIMGEFDTIILEKEIKQAIGNANIIFITCGLGNSCENSSAPIIARFSMELGKLTIAVITLPSKTEGLKKMQNALESLEKLKIFANTIIVIPIDNLYNLVRKVPQDEISICADELIAEIIKRITTMMIKPGILCIDFGDIKSVFSYGNLAMIGIGESFGENRVKNIIEQILNSPLLYADIKNAKNLLIDVSGGEDMRMKEVDEITSAIIDNANPNATVMRGGIKHKELNNKIKGLVIATGLNLNHLPIVV